jgi:hypothetical protein
VDHTGYPPGKERVAGAHRGEEATMRWWFHSEAVMFVNGGGSMVIGGGSNQLLQHQGSGENVRQQGIEERLLGDGDHQRIAVAAYCVGDGDGVLPGRHKVLVRTSLRVWLDGGK